MDWCGADPTLTEAGADEPRTSVETARLWAVDFGLRPGNTLALRASAVEPLVTQWAAARGWTPPPLRAIGRGLAAVGVCTRSDFGSRRLLLHRDDAARLRKLVWEAWAPRVPPGERPRTKPGRQPLQAALARLAYLENKPPTPTFHAQLAADAAREGWLSRASPVVDSRGRVYPSVAYAARHMVGKREKGKAPAQLTAALRRDGHWKGMVWRRLLPEELALIPQDATCGARIEELSWQYACQRMRLLTSGRRDMVLNQRGAVSVARDDGREG